MALNIVSPVTASVGNRPEGLQGLDRCLADKGIDYSTALRLGAGAGATDDTHTDEDTQAIKRLTSSSLLGAVGDLRALRRLGAGCSSSCAARPH